MAIDMKQFLYTKGNDQTMDADLSSAPAFAKVRPGSSLLFWKNGFRWYAIAYTQIQRIRRGRNTVVGRLCAGGRNYDVEYLILTLLSGEELVIHIGDDEKEKAEALVEHLKAVRPEIPFGKA